MTSPGPTVLITLGADGYPAAATAIAEVAMPPDRLWSAIADLERWAGRVPMIHRVRVIGDEAHVQLRFRMALFSTTFAFVAQRTLEPERRLELTWRSGEPRALRILVELAPRGPGCEVRATVGFDLLSLGWLVSIFLRHHPEIRFGIFPGAALALIDGLRRGV